MKRLAIWFLLTATLAACEVRALPVPYPSPNPDGALPDGPRAGAGGLAEAAWLASVPLGGGGGPSDAPSATPPAAPSATPSALWIVVPEPAAPVACGADPGGELGDLIAALPDRTARDPLTIELYSLERTGGASYGARSLAVARLQRLTWRLERRGALDAAAAARIDQLAACYLN